MAERISAIFPQCAQPFNRCILACTQIGVCQIPYNSKLHSYGTVENKVIPSLSQESVLAKVLVI
mgnify:CR=1 FL=1